jgi:hypothetical protein
LGEHPGSPLYLFLKLKELKMSELIKRARLPVFFVILLMTILETGCLNGSDVRTDNLRSDNLGDKEYLSIEQLIRFKNPYMGNSSNIINLNYNLPLGHIPHTHRIDSKNLVLNLYYKETVWELGEDDVKKDLLFNATVNFALIGNLKTIAFHFSGQSFKVTRSTMENWYNMDLRNFPGKSDQWKKKVLAPLGKKEFVENFWKGVEGA